MSISSALNSALSGLTAAGRASEIVSENIANVMTPGYARRSLELASAVDTGPGVKVVGVRRHADPGIISERRGADAEFASAKVLADFHARFEALVGTATDPTSISMRLADFEASLITAASHPESAQRLDAAVYAANDLAKSISGAAEGLRNMRSQADRSIGQQVDRLNDILGNVQKLNIRITATQSNGGDISSLLDQRQTLVDEINQIVPVNQVDRDYGQIALYTDGGAILLDGVAATLDFAVATDVVPEMSVTTGALSGLKINGIDVSERAIAGGTLAANFRVRDDLSVTAQIGLDAMARDLVERFETPTLDATATAGDPGLFTDADAAFDPLAETGLANRIAVNSIVDPARGGDSWRLRAGLAAATPGQPGNARQLKAFAAILSDARAPGSPVFGTGLATAADLSSSLLSSAAQNASISDQAMSFASATRSELTKVELAQGVDTDAEMQRLMIIEQAYAANARMIEAVDEMMKTILRL